MEINQKKLKKNWILKISYFSQLTNIANLKYKTRWLRYKQQLILSENKFFGSSMNILGRGKVEHHIWVELKSSIKNFGRAKV